MAEKPRRYRIPGLNVLPTNEGMWYITSAGDWQAVTGTRAEGLVPTSRTDGTVEWMLPSGSGSGTAVETPVTRDDERDAVPGSIRLVDGDGSVVTYDDDAGTVQIDLVPSGTFVSSGDLVTTPLTRDDERAVAPDSRYLIDGLNTTVVYDDLAGTVQIDTTTGVRTATTLTTGTIAVSGADTGSVAMAKGSVLFGVRETTSKTCRVRLYGASAARDADVARAATTPAVAGSYPAGTGLTCDAILASGTSYALDFDPKPIVGSPDDPPVSTIYWTVDNLTNSSAVLLLEFRHTPFEL